MANIGKGFWTKWLPQSFREKVRRVMVFRPDDPHRSWQVPPANTPSDPGVRNKAYRYPAPNSQPVANVPTSDKEREYDIGYFKTDTIRALPNHDLSYVSPALRAELSDGVDQAKRLLEEKAGPADKMPAVSRGNKNPAVLRYDPTGLRSAMSATDKAMNESIEKYAPDHNVRPAWADEDIDIVMEAKLKGLPPPPGRAYRW